MKGWTKLLARGAVPAAGLLALAVVGATGGAATAAPNGLPVTLGTAIAAGNVVDAHGKPAAHAYVSLLMWPDAATMSSLKQGDAVNLVPVASATTDAAGAFSLPLTDPTVLATGTDSEGDVNFSLMASSSDGSTSHFAFSRRLVASTAPGKAKELVLDPNHATPANVSALMPTVDGVGVEAAHGLRMTLGKGAIDPAAAPEETAPAAAIADDRPLMNKSCGAQDVADYGNKIGLVGAHSSLTQFANVDFTYTQGHSSTLGVGLSMSGTGGWSASGTQTVSSDGEQGFETKSGVGYWHRRTYFSWSKFFVTCYSPYGSSSDYELRSTGWAGGASSVNVGSTTTPSTPAANCVPEPAGNSFRKTTTAAITWSNGANVSDIIGIDLSLQSGYTSAVSLYFTFSRSSHLCGEYDPPGKAPGLLVAKP